MKQKGKILIALLAVVLLLSIAAVALVACNGDGNLPSAPTDPQAPDGHTHIAENFTQVDAPTCTEPGTEGATCTECGEYFTRAIAPLGHDFDWTLTEVNGDLGDEVLTGTIHLTCKRNPNEIYDIEGTAVRTQYSAPTCDAEGFATYNAKGSLDGYEYDVTDTFKLAPHHDWVMGYEMVDGKPEVTLTCSIDGSHIYKTQGEIVSESIVQEGTCSVSGRKSIVISATDEDGHVYQEEDEIDYFAPHSLQGACHWEGEDLWELNVCSNCDYESDKPLPKTLKEEQIYPCTDERESFRTYEYYSEVWDSTFEETFYYKDHKFTEWGFAQEPTCRDEGTKAPKCAICGALSEEGREPVQPSPEFHRFETVYDIDAHWEECSVCQEERGNHIAHAYDTVGECDCGRELFEFELNQTDTYTLKKFNCGVNEVVIPAQYKGVDVTEIGAYAFGVENNESSDIDDYDRSNRLGSVESISLPESITTINEHAFSGCGMTTFNIPASVVKIEGDIDNNVFENCSNLKSISVDPNNAAYCSYDGILYNKADDIDIYHVPQAIEGDVDILNGCWMIGNNAFANRTGMTSVNITSSVQSIGWFSFDGCTGLKTVNIEEGLDSIGGGAFVRCDSLTSFIIPNSVTIFYGSAFTQCENLETLTIGEGVTTIEDGEMTECNSFSTVNWNAINCLHAGDSVSPTFAQCPKFDTINVGEKVQTIPNYIFKDCTHLQTVNWNATNCTDVGSEWISGCTQLATVNIGENVQTIPDRAFSDCTGLQTVNWNATNCEYESFYSIFEDCTKLATVNFGERVEAVPARAFFGCIGLKEVTIPDSVTSIGYNAFFGCTGLNSIVIPDSVTNISGGAFGNCTSLTTVNWNATNCEEAGGSSSSIFSGCTQLATVTIGEGVTTIPTYAFSGCTSLSTVNWNATNCDEAGSRNYSIFKDCTQLASVNFGERVKTVPKYVFSGFVNISEIRIPNSVTSIGESAFSGCSGLQSLTIGEGVQSIGESAFFGCSGLHTVNWNATNCKEAGSRDYATFQGCIQLATVSFGDGVKSVPEHVFWDYNVITKVNVPSLKAWCEIEFGNIYGDLTFSNPLLGGSAKLYVYGEEVTEVKGLDGLTEIPNHAFYRLTDITSVTIPNSVTSIGYRAFSDCTGFTEITIPDNVTVIDDSAFSGCTNLQTVVIGSGVTNIGESAFYGCTSLATVNWNATNCEKVGGRDNYWWIFTQCENLKTCNIGGNVKRIPEYAFYGCTITKVNYLGDLRGWCELEYDYNPLYRTQEARLYLNDVELTGELHIPEGIIKVRNYAFCSLASLTSVSIPKSVQSIGEYAFDGCTGLTEITIPSSVTSIGNGAFHDCADITKVNYLGDLKGWCELEFGSDDANPLYVANENVYSEDYYVSAKLYINDVEVTGEVNIPSGTSKIANSAFRGLLGIMKITIPDSVTSIGKNAFFGCSGLQSVTIGEGVTSIGSQAFYGCNDITNVNYLGDLKGWCEMEYDGGPFNGLGAKRLYLNGVELSGEVRIPEGTTKIRNYAFCSLANITSVSIPNSVQSIGDYAFFGCTELTELTIPEGVQSIGMYAFSGCIELTKIAIPDAVKYLGESSFSNCAGLQTVVLGKGVTFIRSFAFNGCIGLTEITIPSSLTSIGEAAFQGCGSLTSIIIPDGVTLIGGFAFSGCKSLTEITIPDSLTNIDSRTFQSCTGLTSIIIPNSVKSIGGGAFWNCTGLKDIYYAGDETQWNNIQKGEKWDEWGYSESSPIEYQMHYNSTGPDAADAAGEDAEAILQNAVVDVDAPKEWAKQD